MSDTTPPQGRTTVANLPRNARPRLGAGALVMAVLLLGFGIWVLAPVIAILMTSFDATDLGEPRVWSLENWRTAYSQQGLVRALANTFLVYGVYTAIGFPIAVLIAWSLARTNMPHAGTLEFMFWVSFMLPDISTTIGWRHLADGDVGLLNQAIALLPFADHGPFDVFSVPGIIWVRLMSGGTIASSVMLLTPAFRNMDRALEEAGRVAGASTWRTMLRVTLPVMAPAITIVFVLSLARMFQSFETEQILGTPIQFFVYSTKILQYQRFVEPPNYGAATALASIILLFIAVIVPIQRWLITRRQYTTVTGSFRLGLTDLGRWQPVAFAAIVALLVLMLVVPVAVLILGSFMTRVGFFTSVPTFTFDHWRSIVGNPVFLKSLTNTLTLSLTAAIVGPLLFSTVAYVLVRTAYRGRLLLESFIWISAGMPGILAGLGMLWLILRIPVLAPLFGTLPALAIVIMLQAQLISTQLVKGVFLQIGGDMEEMARVAGAGWWATYIGIWIPLLTPTLVLIGVINFVIAAGNASTVILLADRDSTTLALYAINRGSDWEGAGIVSLFMIGMTVAVALIARRLGFQMGLSHTVGQAGTRRQGVSGG
jgi:iron(III) transport system permease protein